MQRSRTRRKLNLSIAPIKILYWIVRVLRSYDCSIQKRLKSWPKLQSEDTDCIHETISPLATEPCFSARYSGFCADPNSGTRAGSSACQFGVFRRTDRL